MCAKCGWEENVPRETIIIHIMIDLGKLALYGNHHGNTVRGSEGDITCVCLCPCVYP